MSTVAFEAIAAAVSIVLFVSLTRGRSRLDRAVVSFGKPGASVTDDIRSQLARQYMRQQAIAFGLVVAAVTMGLLFASTLLYRVILAPVLSLSDAGRAAALAGDVFLGRYAFRSYHETSRRAEKLIVTPK